VKWDSHYFLSVLLQAGGNFIAHSFFFPSRSLLEKENRHFDGASNYHKIPAVAEKTNVSLKGISTAIEIFQPSKIVVALDITDTWIGSNYLPFLLLLPYFGPFSGYGLPDHLPPTFTLPCWSQFTASYKQRPPHPHPLNHRYAFPQTFLLLLFWKYDNHPSFLRAQPTVVSSA
jgi:hypothetical protein